MRVLWLTLGASLWLGACAPSDTGVSGTAPGDTAGEDTATGDTDTWDTDTWDTGTSDTQTQDTQTQDTQTTDAWADVEALVEVQRTKANIAGLAVAVTRPGEVVWTSAHGMANIEEGRPVTVDTPFMLASVSKTVTGVAVMHATETDALALDQDINTLLPFKVDNPLVMGETIRLQHLVTHTSGIRDNWSNMPYADGDSPYALGEYLEGYLVPGGAWYDPSANFNGIMPGTAYEYGNIATALAGYTVEAVTGIPFDDYCDTYIFDVLGLTDTAWHLADFDPDDVAMPYAYTGGTHVAYGHYGYADYPDGQLRSSIADLARFLAAVSNGGEIGGDRILQPDTVEALLSPPVPAVDPGQFVFWYQSEAAGRTVVGHGGSDQGVATSMVFSPDTGIGVIFLLNSGWDTPVSDAVDLLTAALFEHAESQ